MMDDAVRRPIWCCGGGVLIIIKGSLNAFPMRQDDLDSWVDSVCNTGAPAAGGFHNEALTQPAAKRLQGHDKLLESEDVYGHRQGKNIDIVAWTCKDCRCKPHHYVLSITKYIKKKKKKDINNKNIIHLHRIPIRFEMRFGHPRHINVTPSQKKCW